MMRGFRGLEKAGSIAVGDTLSTNQPVYVTVSAKFCFVFLLSLGLWRVHFVR